MLLGMTFFLRIYTFLSFYKFKTNVQNVSCFLSFFVIDFKHCLCQLLMPGPVQLSSFIVHIHTLLFMLCRLLYVIINFTDKEVNCGSKQKTIFQYHFRKNAVVLKVQPD